MNRLSGLVLARDCGCGIPHLVVAAYYVCERGTPVQEGIQARRYDRHDYMPEKRAALGQWMQRMTGGDLRPTSP